jgi:hypothetical protein
MRLSTNSRHACASIQVMQAGAGAVARCLVRSAQRRARPGARWAAAKGRGPGLARGCRRVTCGRLQHQVRVQVMAVPKRAHDGQPGRGRGLHGVLHAVQERAALQRAAVRQDAPARLHQVPPAPRRRSVQARPRGCLGAHWPSLMLRCHTSPQMRIASRRSHGDRNGCRAAVLHKQDSRRTPVLHAVGGVQAAVWPDPRWLTNTPRARAGSKPLRAAPAAQNSCKYLEKAAAAPGSGHARVEPDDGEHAACGVDEAAALHPYEPRELWCRARELDV